MGGLQGGGSYRGAASAQAYEAKLAAQREAVRLAAERQALAAAEAKRVADAKAAADAKIAKDIQDKKDWDLKLGKGKKKRIGGSARTDYHTGLGETQQADIASKSLLGM